MFATPRVLFAAVLSAVLMCPAPSYAAPLDPARDRGLVPHKALYDIKLVSVHNGSQVLNIGGQMYYQWKPSCDAWITDHRFSLSYEYADAPPMQIASDFTTYESFDGKTFDFSSRRRRDGELFQELRGKAKLDQDINGTKAGEVVFRDPPDLKFTLEPGTYLPMMHTLALLDAAKSGKKFFTATVFDGSDDEGPVSVNAFIGREIKASGNFQKAASLDDNLLNTPSWKVRMAFFPENAQEEKSDYEMTMTLHNNGIISDMQIEYDDFAVRQKITAIESVAADECGKPEKVLKSH